jgi:hypothetical protein
LSKKEIDLVRGALCTREGDFLKRERGELLEGLEREFAGRQRRTSTLRLAHIFSIAEVISYRSESSRTR